MRAVVDRIEDSRHAVLLVEDREEKIVDVSELPDGVREGDWLQVTFDDDRLIDARVDHDKTARMKASIHETMKRLRQRGRRRTR